MKKVLSYFVILVAIILASCESDPFGNRTSYRFHVSADTVSFDTVFTSINSVTLNFKIYNPDGADLNIDEIRLVGGSSSSFRLNIDGLPSNLSKDVVIGGGDSMFIFVDANLDVNDESNPLIISDSVLIRNKENEFYVKLLAYGQDVVHVRASGDQDYIYLDEERTEKAVYFEDMHLSNEKPYLFHDHVYVDSGKVLTVDPGVIIYMKTGKSLYVGGTLQMNGSVEAPITVRGDRLDDLFDGLAYDDIDGQWGFIYLLAGSRNNEIQYTNIRNSEYGIIVDTVMTPDLPSLKISHSRIVNISKTALVGRGAHIEADNCLFANCGEYVVAFIIGGKYQMDHCTIGNYYNSFVSVRNEPAVLLNNYYVDGSRTIQPRDLVKADFRNCIIYGDYGSSYELELNATIEDQVIPAQFNYHFDHCLIKAGRELDTLDTDHFENIIWNKDPQFLAPKTKADFRVDTTSVVIGAANKTWSQAFPFDLDGNSRLLDGAPDLGALEFMFEEN